MDTEHPWQAGPTELLTHALEHLSLSSEFDQRIAFLLLDVGVETLLKTFLELPEEVTGSTLSYTKRQEGVKGSFHNLVQVTFESAAARLHGVNAAHLEFYHSLRNKLYHQGNGITIPSEKARGYAVLAVDLLRRLLELDLQPLLDQPHEERRKKEREGEMLEQVLNAQASLVSLIEALEVEVYSAMESVEPAFLLPSFARQFETWQAGMNDRHPLLSRRWFEGEWIPDPVVMELAVASLPESIRRFAADRRYDLENLTRYLSVAYSPTEAIVIMAALLWQPKLEALDRVYGHATLLTRLDLRDTSMSPWHKIEDPLVVTHAATLKGIEEAAQDVRQMLGVLVEIQRAGGVVAGQGDEAKRGQNSQAVG